MATNNHTLQLGHARIDITPPLGVPMGGYGARGDRGCEAIEDHLYADAIYLEQGETRTLLITTDLVAVDEAWGHRVREALASRLDMATANIVLLASHTHFGPATGSYEKVEKPVHQEWLEQTVANLIDVGAQAAATTEEVSLSVGQSDIGPMVYNRRLRRPDGTCCMVLRLPLPDGEPDLSFGPTDPNLTLLRFDKSDGTPALVFYSVAIHPVIGGGDFYGISADYPGVARRILEQAVGAPVAFALGTAANLVPIQRGPGQRERIGRYIAGAALQAISVARPSAAELSIAHERIAMPAEPRFEVDEMERRAEEARRAAEDAKGSGDALAVQRSAERARRAGVLLDYTKSVGAGTTLPFEVTAINLGRVGIATLPGEIFVQTGLELQARSPFSETLVLSLANQSTGYLPTRTAFWAGGYETSVSRMTEESESAAVETANRLLVDVWGVGRG